MNMPMTDMVHIYRTLKIMKEIVEDNPEIVNYQEEAQFWTAWEIVNIDDIKRYAYEYFDSGR